MSATLERVAERDLLSEIGADAARLPHYCGDAFWHWERDVARPMLEARGWTIEGGFFSAEADSFGPLIRAVDCRRGGERVRFFYG